MTSPLEDTDRIRVEAHHAIDQVEAALTDLRVALQRFREATAERDTHARE